MASKMASTASYLACTGYDDERFEHAVGQSFHCIICTNIFKDPVMCRHNEHLFCRACIVKHLTNSPSCPTCMEPLTVDTLTQVPRSIRNILSELKIRCNFFERGCEIFIELGDLEKHVADCGFAPAVCSNEGCQLEVNKQDLAHHETVECEQHRGKCHNCKELSREMDAVKVSLAAINEKLDKSEQKMLENTQRMETNLKAMEHNLVDKVVKLVQEQLNRQKTSNPHVQGQIGEMKKNSTNMTTQQEETKKGIAESNVMDTETLVVVAGGENKDGKLNSVEKFSLSTKTWTQLQPMTECRSQASSIVHDNQVFILGDRGNSGATKSIEKFSTNAVHADQPITWKQLVADVPRLFPGQCSVLYNGRLILIGGLLPGVCSNNITEVNLVPPYNTKLLAVMPHGRFFHAAAIFGDKIIIVGGLAGKIIKNSILSSVVLYDMTKNVLRELAPLPYPLYNMAMVKWGADNVIIIGGTDSGGQPLNKVLIYNIKTEKSHRLPNMKYKRKRCVAAVVEDTVIVIGGADESGNDLKSVESFRFDRYSWEALPEMHEGRWFATAVSC